MPWEDERGEVLGRITSLEKTVAAQEERAKGLDYAHEVGQIVSTCGLIDADGDLVAYKNFSPKAKDADTRFEVQWTEQF